jgi:tRNA G18 (ribose-2'-O)-methylase SpoU
VILDGVRITGNIGAIIRSAVALGAAGTVLVDSGLASAYDRRVIRASRGLSFAHPVVLATREDVAALLASSSATLVSITGEATAPLAGLARIPGRVALLFGGERAGASAGLDALAARRFAIPMTPGVESLNVSTAAAIALYARTLGRRCD